MREDFYFLKTKADKFMDMAEVAFEKGYYDLAALHLEQAAQLYLKYSIGIYLGDFPKTHSLEELLQILSTFHEKVQLKELIHQEKDTINDLYKSYFESRYFDEPITANQVIKMKKLVLRIKDMVL
jgi:HEPN domain-containing protein